MFRLVSFPRAKLGTCKVPASSREILDENKPNSLIAECRPRPSRVCLTSTSFASASSLPSPVSSTLSAVSSSARCKQNFHQIIQSSSVLTINQVLGHHRDSPPGLPVHCQRHGQAPRRRHCRQLRLFPFRFPVHHGAHGVPSDQVHCHHR